MKIHNLIKVFIILVFTSQETIAQNASDSHPGNFYTIETNFPSSTIDGYNLYIPKSCTDESDPFPVLVFLQGGLGVGGNVDVIYNWALPKILRETNELKSELDQLRLNTFIVLMPHISNGQFYENEIAINEILDEVLNNYNADENKIYLTGLSRGGHGTWGLASRIPKRFAAMAPICGAPHGVRDYKAFVNLPIWTSHNIEDDIVGYGGTKEAVNKIENLSGESFHRTHNISSADYKSHDRIFTSGENTGIKQLQIFLKKLKDL